MNNNVPEAAEEESGDIKLIKKPLPFLISLITNLKQQKDATSWFRREMSSSLSTVSTPERMRAGLVFCKELSIILCISPIVSLYGRR